MLTDLILLLFLFLLIGGILVFVTSLSTPPSTSTQVGSSSIDWGKGEVKLRTSMRPVTQQHLLEHAERSGHEGGRFVTQHAQSFSFGKKES